MADLFKKIKIKKQDGTFTDYIPIGAEAQNVSTSDGESVQLKLNKKPYYYNSVADMKADTKLKVGDMVVTLGYYEINDGGGATYKITDEKSETDYQEVLSNDKYATLIAEDFINIKQYGAYGDGIHDDIQAIQKAIDENPLKTIYFPKGDYGITNKIIVYQANNYGVNLKLDENALIKNISNEKLETLIEIGLDDTKGTYSRTKANNVIFVEGGIIDCSNVSKGMVIDSGRQLVQLAKTVFKNIEDFGLYLSLNQRYTSGDVKVSYCDFFRKDSNQGTAIKIDSYDNEIVHIRIDGCQIGIKMTGGFQTFDDIHCTALYNSQSTDDLKNTTIGFLFTQGSAVLSNCYADTYARGFEFDNDNGNYFLTNCCVYYYDAFSENSETSAIYIGERKQAYISITNSKFNSALKGDCAFIRFNHASDYRYMIANDNIHLSNNKFNNTNNLVNYDDPAYCLQLNNNSEITPYYSGQTFDLNSYYYLCSFILSTTLNSPIIRIRNGIVFDATIKIRNSNTIEVIDKYNSYIRTWTFVMVKKRTITFSNDSSIDVYDLYAQVGNNALTNDVNTNISIDSSNVPIFSYRKRFPSAESIESGNILASVTIQKTTS